MNEDLRETAMRWRNPILVPSEIVQGRHAATNFLASRHIGSGTIASAHIGALAIGTGHIAAEAVTAAKIANRTRRLFIPAGMWTASVGTPVLAANGSNLRYNAWAMDSVADESLVCTFALPADASSALAAYIYYTNLGAGAGDVAWRYDCKTTASAGDLNATGAESANVETSTAPTQNVLKIHTIGGGLPSVSQNLVVWKMTRNAGTSASDTLNNDAGFLGLMIEYTADS